MTPLHWAAYNGQSNICRLIIDEVQEKYPVSKDGRTPFHNAAYKARLDVCKLIIGTVEDKNPADSEGHTPLHIATVSGNLDFSDLYLMRLRTNILELKLGGHHLILLFVVVI